MDNLGDIIFDFREKKRLSLKSFGDLCGFSKSYAARLENNRNLPEDQQVYPAIDTYITLARVMGMDVCDLIRSSGDEKSLEICDEIRSPVWKKKNVIYSDENFTLLSDHRILNYGVDGILQKQLLAMTQAIDDGDIICPDTFTTAKEAKDFLKTYPHIAAYTGLNVSLMGDQEVVDYTNDLMKAWRHLRDIYSTDEN